MMDIVIDELPNYICYKLSRKVVQLVIDIYANFGHVATPHLTIHV